MKIILNQLNKFLLRSSCIPTASFSWVRIHHVSLEPCQTQWPDSQQRRLGCGVFHPWSGVDPVGREEERGKGGKKGERREKGREREGRKEETGKERGREREARDRRDRERREREEEWGGGMLK